MQSIIIYGNTEELRLAKSKKIVRDLGGGNPGNELIVIPKEGSKIISIDQAREIIKFLNIKPSENQIKSVLINDANAMSIEAQNAMLKILEEPPVYALIILLASKKELLINTIASRCVLINAGDIFVEVKSTLKSEIEMLMKSGIGVRLDWVLDNKKKLSDDIFVNDFFNAFEEIIREKLIATLDKRYNDMLESLFATRNNVVNDNASVVLGVENLFVNLSF